ncbi:hypothetical protein QYE76_017900, partial [Lolium multiflorum]
STSVCRPCAPRRALSLWTNSWPRAKRTSSRHLMPVPARPLPPSASGLSPWGRSKWACAATGARRCQLLPALRSSLAQGHRALKVPQGLQPLLLAQARHHLVPQHLCLPFGGHNKSGRAAPSSSDHRTEEDLSFLPENQDTSTSDIGREEESCRAGASAPPVPEKTTTSRRNLPAGRFQPGDAPSAPLLLEISSCRRQMLLAPSLPGPLLRRRPRPPSLSRGRRRPPAPLPAASSPWCCTSPRPPGIPPRRPPVLGRITEFQRQGRDLGHLLPYAEKWNAADMTPATRGLGKDRLPAPDPVGDRSSEEHFMRLRSAVKELDSAWYDATNNLMLTADARKALFEELLWEHRELAEAHDKCQVIPEASIDALKEQLAAAQREKDQLIRQHQEELSAHKTSYQELKSQLIQLGLDHAKALKAAEADAAAKMDEALEDASNATVVLRAELEELAKARKGAEEKAARLEEEHKECNQLILQTDALAYREPLSGLSDVAVKKVDARRTAQGQAKLAVPWTPNDHLVALNARVSHMRAIDRNLSDIPDVATQLFRTLWPGEEVPDTFSLISDRLKGAGRRIREWQCSAARAGADSALRVACSWYPELDLDALTGVREGAETDLDPILTAKRQDRAYRIAEYAEMRTFIPPPPDVKDYLDEEEDEAEEEPLDDAGAGDAPPEAPAA